MTPQEITVGVSIVTLASAAMNVYIGLRLTALQAQSKADNATLETRIVTQLSQWKDEVLATINGKYVSGQLIAEIRTSIGRELAQIEMRLDSIEKRCEQRLKECITRCPEDEHRP
jgi:hypothetical protein